MTMDEFAALTRDRIPTPAEFKAFADDMGYRIVRNGDGTPVLRVKDKTDPMARALARMLGREPWRSEVIKLAEVVAPAEQPVEVQSVTPLTRADDPDGIRCGVCARMWFCSDAEIQDCVKSTAYCDRPEPQHRAPMKGMAGWAEPCPWKGGR
jgi:hypothetical protein